MPFQLYFVLNHWKNMANPAISVISCKSSYKSLPFLPLHTSAHELDESNSSFMSCLPFEFLHVYTHLLLSDCLRVMFRMSVSAILKLRRIPTQSSAVALPSSARYPTMFAQAADPINFLPSSFPHRT